MVMIMDREAVASVEICVNSKDVISWGYGV